MKIPPVKGTRDFYPQQMAVRNFIIDGWKAASIRNGFEEYDGPIFELLKMYQIKSGDEIVEQLFNLTDRGGRELAIRPEITPTLARMINQRINSLPRPIKWFSVPRLCRAERPQKGRLREFFQWNIDIIGAEELLADAEIIFTSIDYLCQTGLDENDIVVKISSRKLLAEFLKSIGIAPARLDELYPILDKKDKLPPEAFEKILEEKLANIEQQNSVIDFMSLDDLAGVRKFNLNSSAVAAVDELQEIFSILQTMAVGQFCKFDPSIVRGLAYYTGVVFEIHDTPGRLRAICGGGRYDNLLKDFGGPQIPATGMGMGDCVLQILLEEKGLLTNALNSKKADYYIAYLDSALQQKAVALAARLRTAGKIIGFDYKAAGLSKQLKQAKAAGAEKCLIIGEEYLNAKEFVIKKMSDGTQRNINEEQFLQQIQTS